MSQRDILLNKKCAERIESELKQLGISIHRTSDKAEIKNSQSAFIYYSSKKDEKKMVVG